MSIMHSIIKATLCATTLLFSASVSAEDGKSPWLIRVRIIDVVPDENSNTSIGGTVNVGDRFVPELDIVYFWSDHFATELILATNSHNVGATGTALGDLDLGKVSLLPPTLLAQYHFNPNGKLRPYIGAGINYTFFYNADAGDLSSISYDDGFGYALQAGIDIGLDDNWALNADIKKIFLDTEATINGGAATANVDLDPWIFGFGLAYRF